MLFDVAHVVAVLAVHGDQPHAITVGGAGCAAQPGGGPHESARRGVIRWAPFRMPTVQGVEWMMSWRVSRTGAMLAVLLIGPFKARRRDRGV